MKALPLFLPLFLLSHAALADDAAMLQCRTLTDAGARLACYDAIEVGARLKVASASPAPNKEENFGIEQKKQREAEPKSITSTVAGDFQGWGPSSQIRLANGQVWRIVDGSEAVLPPMRNPQVRIERNVFGTLFLKVEGTNSSAKVRRVQ